MTTLQNEEGQRKSSVYNQTGQNYFQQLSAYNRMSSHLRRTLLAQSVVDSRNKKYEREKRLSSRSSSCSKSLDQILAQGDIIDEVAYDTEHNPIDVLKMSLGCDPNCRRKKKPSLEQINTGCSIECSGISPKTARRGEISSEFSRRSRASNSSSLVKSNRRSSRGSVKSCGCPGRRSDRQPEVDRPRRKTSVSDESRTRQSRRSNRVPEVINETYSYDSSFESSSDTSEPDSPVMKKLENCSPQASRVESIDRAGIELSRQLKKMSDTVERTEEAKYAKFLYDITQEIMLNGLYTDQELQQIFKKHVEMNAKNLDRDKMLSEIYQLKMSLNVEEFFDDEEESDIERFLGSGRFAAFSPKKPPTPPKVLDENELAEKLKNHEESWRQDESRRRSKNSHAGKNTVVLVDANPEMLITERDVLVTLMEMNLDPRQIQKICKSLQKKSRETALLHTVQVDAETSSYSQQKVDRGNSPITGRTERATNESFRTSKVSRITSRDETTGTLDLRDRGTRTNDRETSKKARDCECQCGEQNATFRPSARKILAAKLRKKSGESQTDDEQQPEVDNRASLIDSQSRGVSTLPDRMNGVTAGSRPRSSEFRKMPEIYRTVISASDDSGTKNGPSQKMESFRDSVPKTRRTSSSQRDEDELSEKMENDENERTKRKKRSSSRKKYTTKDGQSDEYDSEAILKLKKEIAETDDKIYEIPNTIERKSTEPKKSVNSTVRKLSEESIKMNVNISEESGATITDIDTERDSPVSPDHEKNDEISDDELASLPEEISQVEDSKNVPNPSSTRDSENYEKSSRSRTTRSAPEKFKYITPGISEVMKLHIVDESEGEDALTSTKFGRDSPVDLTSDSDSKESEKKALVVRRSKRSSKYDKTTTNDRNQGLGSSSVSKSSNGDETRTRPRDDSSISEELAHRESDDFEDKLTDAELNDDLAQSNIRSLELKKNKPTVDDTMINGDKNSGKETHDKDTRDSREPIERSRYRRSTINNIPEENITDRRSQTPRAQSISPSAEKTRVHEQAPSKKRKNKNELCSPCFGKLVGKFKLQSESSATSLEAPRASARRDTGRRRTSFREESMTTASDISLLNREDFNDSLAQLSYEAALETEETPKDEALEANSEKKNSLPWMYVEKDTAPAEEDRLELSAPRRGTIHRRTSMMRSLKSAMENLKKRRNTETSNVSFDFQESPNEPKDHSDAPMLPESRENVPKIDEKYWKREKSSEYTSYDIILPESRESSPETIQRKKIVASFIG